jgi:hypothetical protein
MALRAEFSLINSEFNGFLFAPIGEEESGIELTVFSALTRLAVDPWGEAARLSGLPKEIAAPALASMIARLPSGAAEGAFVERATGLHVPPFEEVVEVEIPHPANHQNPARIRGRTRTVPCFGRTRAARSAGWSNSVESRALSGLSAGAEAPRPR